VGSITRTKLLNHFGSLAKVAQASEEDLREAGLSERVVQQLRREFA
jgi:Nuclease subunit of the excinuclease complex